MRATVSRSVFAVMKTTGYVAYLAKPPGSLDSFVAPFKIHVHQDNVGLIFHHL